MRIRVLFSMLAILVVVGITPAAASADPLDATCQGTVSATFDPGLLLTPQTVDGRSQTNLALCVSATDPTVTSATIDRRYTAVASCLSLLTGGPVVEEIRWSNGQTSRFEATAILTAVGGHSVTTQTGTITAGLFQGDTAEKIIVMPSLNTLDCLAPPGITSRQGTATMEITSVT